MVLPLRPRNVQCARSPNQHPLLLGFAAVLGFQPESLRLKIAGIKPAPRAQRYLAPSTATLSSLLPSTSCILTVALSHGC
jgi:hypothetical protein